MLTFVGHKNPAMEDTPKEKSPVISLKGAEIMNGEATILHDVNMDIYPGDFVYIVGKVGTGKTSIIRTMIGENEIRKGSCNVCGFELNGIRQKDIPFLRRKLGVVFQDFELLMDRPVKDNLSFVLKATGWKTTEGITKRIKKVLEDVGMLHKIDKMPYQLSGGEQQRIAIARALLNDPKVIIADEPTGNLDNETADGIMKLLTRINADGIPVVMVTHHRDIFEKYRGRVFVCKDEGCNEQEDDEVIDLALTI